MLVEAIRDGIVLDHIPSDKLFKIVALLHLEELTTPVTIGNNLQSVRHKRKGIIKMADHFFSPKDVDKIALLAPEVHLNVIRDYQVVEKRKVTLPVEVRGLVRCPNPKCITNAEPMQTFFTADERQRPKRQSSYEGRLEARHTHLPSTCGTD